MTTFVVRIEWDDAVFQAGLRELERLGARNAPLMADISEGLLHSTQDRFKTSTAPDGTPWAPLAASTRAMKRGPKILVEDGYLSGLLRPAWAENLAEVSTAPLPYAQVHQEGGTRTYAIRPRTKTALSWPGGRHPTAKVMHPPMKARPYMGLSNDDQAMILDRVDAAIRRAFSRTA